MNIQIKTSENIINTQIMHRGRPNDSDASQQHIIPCNTFHVSLFPCFELLFEVQRKTQFPEVSVNLLLQL